MLPVGAKKTLQNPRTCAGEALALLDGCRRLEFFKLNPSAFTAKGDSPLSRFLACSARTPSAGERDEV